MAAVSVATPPSVIQTHLNYYLEVADGGQKTIYPGTAGDKLKKHNVQPVEVREMRNGDFTLEKNGFQLLRHTSKEKTFDDNGRVQSDVYDETAELLKEVTGATRVYPFSHMVRRAMAQNAIDNAKTLPPDGVMPGPLGPAMFCHIDQSYTGADELLHEHLPDEAEKLQSTRWGIINVWRPIERVTREPLTVSDATSIADSDLREVFAQHPKQTLAKGIKTPSSKGGFHIWNVAANPAHKWFYASDMTPDETLLIKIFDSKKDGRARRCAHSAFQSEHDHGPARQSIEVRCLVFWEDQTLE